VSIVISGNTSTEWFRLDQAAAETKFMLTGPFSGTVSLQYSNNGTYQNKGTDFTTDPRTFTAAGVYEIPFGIARFVRFVGSGWASGTCVPSFGHTKNSNGGLFIPTPEQNLQPPVTS
jgi:hypothetical protein